MRSLFPLIETLSPELAESVEYVWGELGRASSWTSLTEARFYYRRVEFGLVDYTHSVVVGARSIAGQISNLGLKHFPEIDIEVVTAGALLHGVDWLLHFSKTNNELHTDRLHGFLPPGQYGVYFALKAGLPLAVVSVMGFASAGFSRPTPSAEAAIVSEAVGVVMRLAGLNGAPLTEAGDDSYASVPRSCPQASERDPGAS